MYKKKKKKKVSNTSTKFYLNTAKYDWILQIKTWKFKINIDSI